MSAFVVEKVHIDAMIHAGLRSGSPARGAYTLQWRVSEPELADVHDLTGYHLAVQAVTRELTRDTANRVGAMLWNENKVSVDYRYQDHAPADRDVYRFRESCVSDPVVILKAIDCYEYQTCEHKEWPTSEAFAFCQALRKAMISMLPGYDDAPWGIGATREVG